MISYSSLLISIGEIIADQEKQAEAPPINDQLFIIGVIIGFALLLYLVIRFFSYLHLQNVSPEEMPAKSLRNLERFRQISTKIK